MENIELLVILCILLGLSNWFIFYQNNKFTKYNYDDNILDKLNKHIIELKENNRILELKENNRFLELKESNRILELKENNRILELKENMPPERKNMINIRTRGNPDDYQLIGILMKNDIEVAYNLYGRQTYPGSSKYEYYTHAIINNNNIKIPLDINKEIFDGQEININSGSFDNKNTFKVKLYPYNLPKYIPY